MGDATLYLNAAVVVSLVQGCRDNKPQMEVAARCQKERLKVGD